MTIQTNEEIPAKKMGLLDAYATEDEIKKNTKLFLDPTKIDISLKEMIYGKKTDKKMAGGMMQGYGAARTSGMGLEDQSLMPGQMVRANKGKMLSAKHGKMMKK